MDPYFTGERNGRLVLIETRGKNPNGKLCWVAQCDCGNKTLVIASLFRKGRVRSCGCLRDELNRVRAITHGMAASPEHKVWLGMKSRCNNPKAENYRHYGGRGIKVCEAWEDFANFYKDVGPRPSPKHTIERVDHNGNYEPSNCVWLHNSLQNQNRRDNKHVTLDGEDLVLAEAFRRANVSFTRFYWRTNKYGETPQEAFDYVRTHPDGRTRLARVMRGEAND